MPNKIFSHIDTMILIEPFTEADFTLSMEILAIALISNINNQLILT